ncbi:hypothetical protein R3P38DRAFT_3254158 [Favolaschia claudopus]|uniref:Uncharacterized protein n=1 Tax=Favolaschia claudopus TaxID=2862362 RepID=A0AAW0DP05_9AGAR
MATISVTTPGTTTGASGVDTGTTATSTCITTAASCGVLPSPGTLYLFTFLATLLLLVVLAAGIISRSIYLRRRQLNHPPANNNNRRQPKPEIDVAKSKPRFYDAEIPVFGWHNQNHYHNANGTQEKPWDWEYFVPLSAGVLTQPSSLNDDKSPPAPTTSPSNPDIQTTTASLEQTRSRLTAAWRTRFGGPMNILQHPAPAPVPVEPPSGSSPNSNTLSPNPPPRTPPPSIALSYIVLMPSVSDASTRQTENEKEKEESVSASISSPPYFEMGFIQLQMKGGDSEELSKSLDGSEKSDQGEGKGVQVSISPV